MESVDAASCDHGNLDFSLTHNGFGESNVHVVELAAFCKACGARMRFLGAPMGLSTRRPATDFSGEVATIPMVAEFEMPNTQFEQVSEQVH